MDRSPPAFCGTTEGSIFWCNSTDSTGIIFAAIVIACFVYVIVSIIYIVMNNYIDTVNGSIVCALIFMSLLCHLRTMLGDPGAVPIKAHPRDINRNESITMCGRCDCYKPNKSHHDRISNRCISRMDHFCPWTNNAIGAKNQKHFFLFLIYTDIASIYLYILLVIHLAYCDALQCQSFESTSLVLARILIFIVLFAMLFTSSMILNQVYGLMIGLGTIDRMKLKDGIFPVEVAVPFNHVFGDQWWFHLLPVDPVFYKPEEVLHYKLGSEAFNPGKV